MPVLETQEIVKRYESGAGTLTALKGVDFSIEAGEFVSIMGPSGSGKSTLLNILGLLDVPTEGHVLLDGEDVTDLTDRRRTRERRRTIGFVFQQFYLLPTLSAVENVTVPRMFDRADGAEAKARDLLERVGLGDRLDHHPF